MTQKFWPDNISRRYRNDEQEEPTLKLGSAQIMVCIVSDLTFEGARHLRECYDHASLVNDCVPKWRLMLGVNPASATQANVLQDLLGFQQEKAGSVVVRLLLPRAVDENRIAMNVFLWLDELGRYHVNIGSLDSMGIGCDSAGTANLLLESPEPIMLDDCRKFFDYQWEKSTDLSPATCNIPHLIPAVGDPAALARWERYQDACAAQQDTGALLEVTEPEIDIATGEVIKPEGEKLSQTIKLPAAADMVQRIIADLYSQGKTVTLEHKIKPLQVPLSANALGIQAVRHEGNVTRSVNFRIDMFDEITQRKLDNMRNGVRGELNLFGFSLAKGLTWIPDMARTKLDERIHQIQLNVDQVLGSPLKNGIDAFLESRKSEIRISCERFLTEMLPGKKLQEETLAEVMQEMRERVSKAQDGNYLPTTTFGSISFSPITSAIHEDGWAQAASLLADIAIKPRKAIENELYFVRDLKPDLAMRSFLKLINVLKDHIIARYLESPRDALNLAQRELRMVKEFDENTQISSKEKCGIYLAIIEGKFACPPPIEDYDWMYCGAILSVGRMIFYGNGNDENIWKQLMLNELGAEVKEYLPVVWKILCNWPQDKKFDSETAMRNWASASPR